MKSLLRYITEEYNTITLHEVVVKFAVANKDIVVEVPDSYLEDQINTYIDDTIINKTFIGDDYSNELFGKNSMYISDVYFEYTALNKTALNPDIKWDNKNTDNNVYETDLKHVKLSNLKFVIMFNKFELLDNENDDNAIKAALVAIFNRCVSDEYEWPLNFVFNEEDVEFKR